jgi:hypothetical protein
MSPGGVDWLNDLEPPPPRVQRAQPPDNATPDWLADVAEIEASLQSAPRSLPEAPLDWLADIQELESLRAPAPPTTLDVAPTSPTRLETAQPPISPPTIPVPTPAPVERQPTSNPNSPPASEDVLVKRAIAETGHDPTTGEILDRQLYEKWQRLRVAEAKATQLAITTESIGEVYYNARATLARWVDDDSRRPLILDSDLEDLKKNPEVQALLDRFHNYGPVMREKLVQHLEYLVINRRQYYRACLK